MKNKKIVILLICIVLILGLIYLTVNLINNARRNYNLEKIEEKSYYTLYKSGKVGVINTSGDIIIKPEYNYIQIPNPSKDVYICSKNINNAAQYITLNSKSEEIFTQYEEVTAIQVAGIIGDIPYEKSVLRYKQNGLYGLINFEGKMITKPIYEKIESVPYKEGELLVQKEGKQGVINSKGVELVKVEYDIIIGDGYYNQTDYKEAGYIVGKKQDNKITYGYLNNKGEIILNIDYNEITRINNIEEDKVYLITTKNGKKGLVKNGKIVFENVYDQFEYNETIELIKIKQGEKYGIVDLDGNIILPVEYETIEYKGIYISGTKANTTTDFDRSGKKVTGNIYKKVIATENKDYFITVGQNNLYGIINEKGVETTVNKYTYIEYLIGEYFAAYNSDNQIGIIDQYGNTVLPIQYNLIQRIKGTNMVQVNNTAKGNLEIYSSNIKQIAIMRNAKLYINKEYIKIVSDTETKYISLDGRILTNKQALPNNTLFAVSKYGLWGFEDKDGNLVVEQVYDMVTEFNKYGFAGIKQENKWGIINEQGRIIVEPTYEITSSAEPEFLGRYYKINYGGEDYFTDEKI